MNNLVRIIGPAPSEMPFEDFMRKLDGERRRLVAGLSTPYSRKKPTKKAIKKEGQEKMARALASLGMSPEEFLKELEMREAEGEH